MDAHLRAADSDRQQVIDALDRHTTEGRLSLDEFTTRLDAVHRARTFGDLAALTVALPTLPTRRPVPATFTITALLLAVLLGAAALTATAGGGRRNAMMISMSTDIGTGCR